MKPLLFLDVDGVINCLNLFFSKSPAPFEAVDWGHGLIAAIPEGTKERVEQLTEHFAPVWATAWFGHARLFNKHWDQEPWPFLHWHDMKLPAIVRRAAKGTMEPTPDRRWAFVDDDAYWEASEFNQQFGPVPEQGLVVPVAPHRGLTDAHVGHLIEWANRQ
jgi:hypothetical protein